jgi:flagellar biosynthesis GTPase FlhF
MLRPVVHDIENPYSKDNSGSFIGQCVPDPMPSRSRKAAPKGIVASVCSLRCMSLFLLAVFAVGVSGFFYMTRMHSMQELELMTADFNLMQNPVILKSLNDLRGGTSEPAPLAGSDQAQSRLDTGRTAANVREAVDVRAEERRRPAARTRDESLQQQAEAARRRRGAEKVHRAELQQQAAGQQAQEEADKAAEQRARAEVREALDAERSDLKHMEEEAAAVKPAVEPYNKLSSDDEAFQSKWPCSG